MNAHVNVHEQRPPESVDSPLAFSMEGHSSRDSALTTSYWAPAWNSVQSLNKFQHEVGGALRGGDPGRLLIEGKGVVRKDAHAGEWIRVVNADSKRELLGRVEPDGAVHVEF